MKTLPLLFALLVSAGIAQAADAPAPAADKQLTPQQQRMADCNKQAGDKKGPDRRDFMRQCMHGNKPAPAAAAPVTPAVPATPAAPAKPEAKPADAPKMSQQDRMRDCNKQASEKGVKGPDRRAFMSDCLKNK
jgi:hypothetical protein